MAGGLKPNIIGLGSEIKCNFIYSNTEMGGGKALFDGIGTNRCYWNSIGAQYVEVNIYEKCNIWRRGSSYPTFFGSLKILHRLSNTAYEDLTHLYPQTVTKLNTTEWEKTISNLPAGQYRFSYGTTYRMDSQWYLEKPTDRYLIKQNNQYYSVKDNILTELGIPADDTQKEQWFNDCGVDTLKDALLTPDENGKKLIDSLDDKFEVRMMVPKD